MNSKISVVIDLMINNLHRELTLEEMAKQVNLSPSRLRHLFKAEIDRTPTEYLRLLRVQKAREWLESSQLSVKEIMVKVGVTERSSFIKNFKKIYGFTPTQYREHFLNHRNRERAMVMGR
jgi:transcriptional regulator GlxA family with amidase domain